MFEWSDLRYFLAVARAGTLSAAARELGVAQTTVGRRLEVLEDALGSRFCTAADRLCGLAAAARGRAASW